MAYETLAEAQAAAVAQIEANKNCTAEIYGGVMILRALDGVGYGLSYGTPEMAYPLHGEPEVFAEGRQHRAEIVEFLPVEG